MADWVHCNTCYKQPGHGKKFNLTSCGHIYCEDCVISVKETKCHICSNRCTTIPLQSKMKPDVEIFFIDASELWKKQLKQMQKIVQVMEFQKNHRSRLAAYNRDRQKKQAAFAESPQKMVEHMKMMEKEIMVVKEENSYLQKIVSAKGSGVARSPGMMRQNGPHISPQAQAKICLSQPAHHSKQPSPTGSMQAHLMKQQGRMYAKTPPSGGPYNPKTPPTGRFGLPQTPSPKGMSGVPGMEPNMPSQYESRRSRSCGHSPMNTSPAHSQSKYQYGHGPPLPPTCMPITPNRPVTPNYIAASPATSVTQSQHGLIMSSQRANELQRHPMQGNYPRPGYRVS